MITTIVVCILAGLGAGLGTGFAGMSAAAVISPKIYLTCTGLPPSPARYCVLLYPTVFVSVFHIPYYMQ